MTASREFYLVDDDPIILRLVKALLEGAGHRTRSSSSSRQALDEIVADPPECVLVDIMMPEMDGLELCKELRSHENLADTKIVFVTGKHYDFDRQRARQFGANGYVVKPIKTDRFVKDIEEIIADRVNVTYWGVRGTLPVVGPRAHRYGGNTCCVSMEFQNDRVIIFDAGTGIKELSDAWQSQKRARITAKIFISHPHWDHINTLPYFAPLYVPGNDIQIIGPGQADAEMRDLVSAQMNSLYYPVTTREFGARVYYQNLREDTVEIGGVTVRSMLLSHPGYCLGYRVDYGDRSLCYITDNEFYDEDHPLHNPNYVKRLADFVRGANVLITDCTYLDEEYPGKVGWGHACVRQVVDFATQAEVETVHLFHHDPDQSDEEIARKVEQAQTRLKEIGSSVACDAPAERSVHAI